MGSMFTKQKQKQKQEQKKNKQNSTAPKLSENRNVSTKAARAKTKKACDSMRKLQKMLPLPSGKKVIDQCMALGV